MTWRSRTIDSIVFRTGACRSTLKMLTQRRNCGCQAPVQMEYCPYFGGRQTADASFNRVGTAFLHLCGHAVVGSLVCHLWELP